VKETLVKDEKFSRLQSLLYDYGSVVIGYSGGVDSSFLAKVATETLGATKVLSVTALSPSLTAEEADAARAQAREWGLNHKEVATAEFENPDYLANNADRCAHCKEALMDVLGPLAHERGSAALLGVNVDDLGDHRPGQIVAKQAGAHFPLVDAGFTKVEVRRASGILGLRTADKPASPCLSSRIPYGTPVSLPALKSIGEAERALRGLGFETVRVRHHASVARVEIPSDRLAEALEKNTTIVTAVKSAGYQFVALDLEGFSSGSMNRLIEKDRNEEGR